MGLRPTTRATATPGAAAARLLVILAVVAAAVVPGVMAPGALAAQDQPRPPGVAPPRATDYAVEGPPFIPVVAPGERVEIPVRVVQGEPHNETYRLWVQSGHPGWSAYFEHGVVRVNNSTSGAASLVVRAPAEFVNEGEVYVFGVQATNGTDRLSGVTNVAVMVRPSSAQLFRFFALPTVMGVVVVGAGHALRRVGHPTVGGLAVMAGAMVAVASGSALLALVLL